MPSFFESLKRMAQGKPVFDAQDAPEDSSEGNKWEEDQRPGPQVAPAQPISGPKVLPQVTIQRVECRLSGEYMDCDFFIRNDSQVVVELDAIRLLQTSDDINDHLQPGEMREFRVYSGPRPRDTYTDNIELTYKDMSGDYFCSRHHAEFEKQPDNTYIIHRVRFTPPVKDV